MQPDPVARQAGRLKHTRPCSEEQGPAHTEENWNMTPPPSSSAIELLLDFDDFEEDEITERRPGLAQTWANLMNYVPEVCRQAHGRCQAKG